MDEKIRINKYLSEIGFCSRREADRLLQEGRVLVEGQKAQPGEKVTADAKILVDGKPVKKVEQKVLLLFYKPRGVVCSTKKQRQETTVIEYLDYPIRIYPIGRLDKESEGLLLLTNQGDLVNRIMRAGNYHEKEYLVTVDKPIDQDFVRKMAGGVPILDTVTRPCQVEKTGRNSFRIILTQGLNRQIRRMCEYLGYQVRSLKRVRIMDLTLDGLSEGMYREASKEELAQLEMGLKGSSELPASKDGVSDPAYRSGSRCNADRHHRSDKDVRSGKRARSGKYYNLETGGHHGKSDAANERTGRDPESGRKGILSGRPGDHEQSGVRQSVRSAGGPGKRDRYRTHK